MKKILSLILALTLVFALAACGGNEVAVDPTDATEAPYSDAAYITDKGTLVIGMTLFAPMDYIDENGDLTGFEVEFGKAVCEKLGVEPEFIEINWDAKETELSAKNIDCIWNGMTITPERSENMSISVPYMTNKQVVVAKAENAEKYATSLAGALVVAESGSAGEELATSEEFFADANFTAVDSMAKALMEVAAGTADVAVVDYVASIGSIGEGTDFENLVVVETEEFSPEQYGIAFRKGSDMTAKVNEAIAELAADGTLAEIAAKYKLDEVLSVQ